LPLREEEEQNKAQAAIEKENIDQINTHVTQSPAKPKENEEDSEEEGLIEA